MKRSTRNIDWSREQKRLFVFYFFRRNFPRWLNAITGVAFCICKTSYYVRIIEDRHANEKRRYETLNVCRLKKTHKYAKNEIGTKNTWCVACSRFGHFPCDFFPTCTNAFNWLRHTKPITYYATFGHIFSEWQIGHISGFADFFCIQIVFQKPAHAILHRTRAITS